MNSLTKKVLSSLLAGAVTVTAGAVSTDNFSVSPKKQTNIAQINKRFADKLKRISAAKQQSPTEMSKKLKAAPKMLAATSSLPTLYGSILYSSSWADLTDSYPYGIYAFQPTSPISFSEICIHDNVYINGGGAYSDHKLHYRLWSFSEDYSEFINFYVVLNTDDWSFVNVVQTGVDETVANDMTYDPITKNLYGIVWGPYESTYCDFAKIDLLTGETSTIAKLPDMACIAANNFGEIYAVSTGDGITYQIDKNTGVATKIGASGLTPKYLQSATVDPETNIIYWAETGADETAGLYKLNTSTGKAELVSAMPGNEEITSLFIEAPTKGLNAPAALENVTLVYANGNSKISFNAPTKAFDGTALSGNITTKIYIDGTLADEQTVAPGAKVEVSKAVTTGEHAIVAFAENTVGEGPKTVRNQWTGADVPGNVQNLKLSVTDNVATLTWGAPIEGLHGGIVDSESLQYTITRYPDATVVAEKQTATSFTETLPTTIATYYYTVTAYTADGEGATTMSNSWFAGDAITLPYYQPFDTSDSFTGFTVIDDNNDGNTWVWREAWKAACCRFSKENQANDWLLTPPIEYKKSSSYKLTFKARAFDVDSPEKFEVTIGPAASVIAQTTTLIPITSVTSDEFKTYSATFTVPNDGVHHIGFHCISPRDNYYLIIDDITIEEEASAESPAAVTNLKATAGPAGTLSATLTFNAPSKTFSGAALTSLKAINIYKGDATIPAQVISNPAPGSAQSWTDTNASAGDNTYRVVPVNEVGSGIESTVTVYVGSDTPNAVTNLKAKEEDSKAVLTWTAPTKGVNGAVLDQSILTYKITKNDGTVIAEGVKGNTYTDETYASTTSQVFVYYMVTPVYGEIEGDGTLCDYIILGPDNQVPFTESFKEGGLDSTPWALSRVSGDNGWNLVTSGVHPTVSPQDGDGGMASFNSFELMSGTVTRMTSPKIDLFSAQHPVISFWMYQTTTATETLEVEISHNDHNYVSLGVFPVKGSTEGWKQFTIEVPRAQCLESSMITFKASSGDGTNIHLDNISIYESTEIEHEYDLEAVSISMPSEMNVGETVDIEVTIYNNGSQTISNYTVNLLCDGAVVMTGDGAEIEAGATMIYKFPVTAEESDYMKTYGFQGSIACDVDQDKANNTTDKAYITIVKNGGINGAQAANVKIAGGKGFIAISNVADEKVTIHAVDGRTVKSFTAHGASIIPMHPGMYIVNCNGTVKKVIVQ